MLSCMSAIGVLVVNDPRRFAEVGTEPPHNALNDVAENPATLGCQYACIGAVVADGVMMSVEATSTVTDWRMSRDDAPMWMSYAPDSTTQHDCATS